MYTERCVIVVITYCRMFVEHYTCVRKFAALAETLQWR